MCVICASPIGVRQPSISEIYQMFDQNPHGAGYMVARDGKVEIHKGFMDVDEFVDQIKAEDFTASDPVVYHFRVSTQAGVNPEMTHPFPLTNQLKNTRALDVVCGCGIAHNGIITLTSDPDEHTYSDTALFVVKYLYNLIHKPSDLHDPKLLNQIFELAQSKLAIMDGSGYIATVGKFINDRGLLFSNLNHLPYRQWQKFRPTYSWMTA